MSYFKEFSKDNIIVMSAPSGARKMKQDHPQLPLTVKELADCAESLVDTGVFCSSSPRQRQYLSPYFGCQHVSKRH